MKRNQRKQKRKKMQVLLQSQVILKINQLESALASKAKMLTAHPPEERKESATIWKRFNELRQSLYMAINKVMDTVQEKVTHFMEEQARAETELQHMKAFLLQKRTNWEDQLYVSQETEAKELEELERVEKKIQKIDIKDRDYLRARKMLHFSSEEMYLAIMKTLLIQQDEVDPQEEQDYLLYKEGRIDIRRGRHEDMRLQRKIRDFSACFQICRKLYLCGGEREITGKVEFLNEFFSTDYFGKCEELAPLIESRSCLSLCGQPSILLALGGFKEDTLSTVEQYIVSIDKWEELAPLNKARRWAGSCLLPSRQAYCFCGTQGYLMDLNTIETMNIESPTKWTLLTVNQKIVKSFHLSAIPFEGGILLFGGSPSAKYCCYLLNEQGEVLNDFTSDPLIPGAMCIGATVKKKGKVFAVGKRRVRGQAVWGVKVFNGSEWIVLSQS